MLRILILVLFSVNALADDWTREDTIREVTYLAIDMADWAQTRNIARNSDKCLSGGGRQRFCESNPVLGPRPSIDRVDAWFISMMLVHYVIASELPSEYRAPFQYLSIGFETGVVARNLRFGVGISF